MKNKRHPRTLLSNSSPLCFYLFLCHPWNLIPDISSYTRFERRVSGRQKNEMKWNRSCVLFLLQYVRVDYPRHVCTYVLIYVFWYRTWNAMVFNISIDLRPSSWILYKMKCQVDRNIKYHRFLSTISKHVYEYICTYVTRTINTYIL